MRSQAQKNVDALEAMVSGTGAQLVHRYKINNRELQNYSVKELLELLSYWRGRLQNEKRKARGESLVGPDIRVFI
jgi:hypothetical protein